MMMSLFSVFDPVAMMGLSLNWLSLVTLMMVLPVCVKFLGGRVTEMYSSILAGVGGMFMEISTPNGMGIVMMGVGLFFFIMLNNALGLFPFIFTSTSHIMVTLSMGMVMWFSFFLMGWLKEFKDSSAHLVPEGAPMVLAPFMVLIESVSHMIRPITLSVRLAANMMAGHLIIGLIATISLVSVGGMISSVFMQSVMLVLEVAVAVIQAFVFSVLVLLYALEYY